MHRSETTKMIEPETLEPSMLEIASNVVLGVADARGPSVSPEPMPRPLAALQAAILPAVARPPCLVSFSGGMDSSFVLSVATKLAREQGLPDPVPVTWRFIGAPRAQESSWQDSVVADLKIVDWHILTADDDLDLIGPVARRMLTRYGVRYPVNSHLHVPLLEMAHGGSLLTGWGGDQVLTGWRPSRRPKMGSALRAKVPDRLVAVARQHRDDPFPWLRRSVSRELIRDVRAERRRDSWSPAERLDHAVISRDVVLANAGLAEVAADQQVHLIHPFLDQVFVASLRSALSDRATLSRSEILRGVSGGAFPDSSTAARPKAHFHEVFFREPTREFTRTWDGQGADATRVDRDALRRLWAQWPIPLGTAGLVQQLWLRSTDRLPAY